MSKDFTPVPLIIGTQYQIPVPNTWQDDNVYRNYGRQRNSWNHTNNGNRRRLWSGKVYSRPSSGSGGLADKNGSVERDETRGALAVTGKGVKRHYEDNHSSNYYQNHSSTTTLNSRAHWGPDSLNIQGDSEYAHKSKRKVYASGAYASVMEQKTLFHPDPDSFLQYAQSLAVCSPPLMLDSDKKYAQLSTSIWNKYSSSHQTPENLCKKLKLWKDLYTHVKENDSTHQLYVVGSTLSGFGTNSSDIDMCLLVPSMLFERAYSLSHLYRFQDSLYKCSFVEKPQLIQAKVPIVKFRDRKEGLEVDLNCNNEVGIRNTHLLYSYSQMDWRLKPLAVIIKLWAQYHNINDARSSTISSYSLVLMVIHYLQCGVSPPVLPCLQSMYPEKFSPHQDVSKINIHEKLPPYKSDNEQSLGELLLGFLDYYCNKFDYKTSVICIRLATTLSILECMFRVSRKNEPRNWKYICIEEPFDFTNTARSVYDYSSFLRIRKVFKNSHELLKKTLCIEDIFGYIG